MPQALLVRREPPALLVEGQLALPVRMVLLEQRVRTVFRAPLALLALQVLSAPPVRLDRRVQRLLQTSSSTAPQQLGQNPLTPNWFSFIWLAGVAVAVLVVVVPR